MAILIACLAFPALEAIIDEPSDQWSFRLLLIAVVIITAILAPLFKRLMSSFTSLFTLLTIVLLWDYWRWLANVGLSNDSPIGC